VGAVVLGFVLGLAVAVLRARTDDRIDSDTGPFIAHTPVWARLTQNENANATATSRTSNPGALEAYRRLRTATIANLGSPSVIAITSPHELPTLGDVGFDLALSLKEAAYNCIIVDMQLDK
jgi:hypothetical protein